MKRPFLNYVLLCSVALLFGCAKKEGTLLDIETGKPIPNAHVYHSGKMVQTGKDGRFVIRGFKPEEPIHIKASGYRRLSTNSTTVTSVSYNLQPFQARGLYLGYGGTGFKPLRNQVLQKLKQGKLNTLVMDVKGDRGMLSFQVDVPLAGEAGALSSTTIEGIRDFVAELQKNGTYLIGRIVVFRDPVLAKLKPEWAIQNGETKKPWTDGANISWMDPFVEEVWQYNIDIAAAAAEIGFDEIQFDYLRFPTDENHPVTEYRSSNSYGNRTDAINSFLEAAQEQLARYNVYLSAAMTGYTPWNGRKSGYGQTLEDQGKRLDYLSPLIFPSSFPQGLPGHPKARGRQITKLSLEKSRERLGGTAIKMRPWLQCFAPSGGKDFTAQSVQAQIEPCQELQTGGWLLWDPSNKYTNFPAIPPASNPSAVQQDNVPEAAMVR